MNVTTRRRMICVVLLGVACASAFAEEPAEVSTGARLALSQADLIQRVSEQFPCTAAAILQALVTEPASEGTLLLDRAPTPEMISRLLGSLPSEADVRGTLLAFRNPYSDQAFFIDTRWVVSWKPDNTVLITFRTQWVGRDGAALSPRHLVEPDGTLLISEQKVQFTARSGRPSIVASRDGARLPSL